MRAPLTSWQIWRWPAALGLLGTLGLLAALLSDGLGDWISWLSLAVPLLAVAWFVWRPRESGRIT